MGPLKFEEADPSSCNYNYVFKFGILEPRPKGSRHRGTLPLTELKLGHIPPFYLPFSLPSFPSVSRQCSSPTSLPSLPSCSLFLLLFHSYSLLLYLGPVYFSEDLCPRFILARDCVRPPVPTSWFLPHAGLHLATAHFRLQELGHGTRYRPRRPVSPRRLSSFNTSADKFVPFFGGADD